MTEKQWTKWFWSDFNKRCKNCTHSCKQSDKVIVSCSKRIKIKEEKDDNDDEF